MTHQEVIDGEVIEQYVLDRLAPDRRREFQEHFFACDECFQEAQATAKFVAGVRHASATGVLKSSYSPTRSQKLWDPGWWRPVLIFSSALCLLLAAAVVWLLISRARLQNEIARERQSQQLSEADSRKSVDEARLEAKEKAEQLEIEKSERDKLQERLNELESNKNQRPDENLLAANVPSVTLESSRGSGNAAQLVIPAKATHARLSMPIEKDSRFKNFSVEMLDNGRSRVETINVTRGKSDVLSATITTARLDSGDYRIRLFGLSDGQRELVAEYDLHIIRQ